MIVRAIGIIVRLVDLSCQSILDLMISSILKLLRRRFNRRHHFLRRCAENMQRDCALLRVNSAKEHVVIYMMEDKIHCPLMSRAIIFKDQTLLVSNVHGEHFPPNNGIAIPSSSHPPPVCGQVGSSDRHPLTQQPEESAQEFLGEHVPV